MAEQLPIENHYGAMLLIESCWSEDTCKSWRDASNTLHGGVLLADDREIYHDLNFLRDIAYTRLEMLSPDWSKF